MKELLLMLVLAIFTRCPHVIALKTVNPIIRTDCFEDAFISSLPFEGKVFLHPVKTKERKGDWNYNRAYCAANCAEMVMIHSAKENLFFHEFMRSVGMKHPGAWLGAQIIERRDIRQWYNGEEFGDYCPKAPGEFNEAGVTCLDVGWNNAQTWWRNWYCTGAYSDIHFIACQRPANTSFTNRKPSTTSFAEGPQSSWTMSNNNTHRCFCAEEKPTLAVPCFKSNDLIIVLSESESIGSANYQFAKQFVDELASAFSFHNDSRIGFMTYSDSARVIIDMKNTLSPAEISSKILNAPYQAGASDADSGINKAVIEFISSSRTVPLNMVLITDGECGNPTKITDAARRALNLGIHMFVVGVTSKIKEDELLIVTGGESSHIFTMDKFQDIKELLAPVSLKICSDI